MEDSYFITRIRLFRWKLEVADNCGVFSTTYYWFKWSAEKTKKWHRSYRRLVDKHD